MIECTGISAGYCQICGDCTCRDQEDKNDDDCPLHGDSSKHGEVQTVSTVWGDFILEPE